MIEARATVVHDRTGPDRGARTEVCEERGQTCPLPRATREPTRPGRTGRPGRHTPHTSPFEAFPLSLVLIYSFRPYLYRIYLHTVHAWSRRESTRRHRTLRPLRAGARRPAQRTR
jgi:hypothetical protein